VFMNNIHGRRVNRDVLKRRGSGYTASHAADIMVARDPWFMGVTLAYGPDGGVFVSDWSDTGECHSVKNTRKHTGRIYKITHGQPEQPGLKLAENTNAELAQLQLHRNDWFVRHARRLLQERSAAGKPMQDAAAPLRDILNNHPDVTRKLRALWALHVIDGADEALLSSLLKHDDEHLRAWSIRLLCENKKPSADVVSRLAQTAAQDDSPLVRLHLASALQRLPRDRRWGIAEGLAGRAEDAEDPNIPLMLWYGIQPLVETDVARFVKLAESAEIPLIRQHIARRVAAASR